MSTVYAVSSGSYSDYMVHYIFEDRADAEQHAALFDYRVEEFDFYPAGQSPQVFTEFYAFIAKAGRYDRPAGAFWEHSTVAMGEPKHEATDMGWAFRARGPDRERCVKSVRDRYAQWLAARENVA